MLEIRRPGNRTRREILRAGALGMLGLTLADLLRMRAHAGLGATEASVIQIYLAGGPSHLETFDPKPDAPSEFRGALRAIPSALPGVSVCELFPKTALGLRDMALIRSIRHTTSDHNSGSHWMLTGYPGPPGMTRANTRPSVGSIAAKLRSNPRGGLPAYVTVPSDRLFAQAGYLGPGFNPFTVSRDSQGGFKVRDIERPEGVSIDRLEDRKNLLRKLDALERDRDATGEMAGLDAFNRQAYAMVTGPSARRAFDLSLEDPRTRERYGKTAIGDSCLLARRLVEAGVAFVTISDGNWDHHGQIADNIKRQAPPLDQALSALVQDIRERGLDRNVLVVVWGEFGRTPRVNGGGGRDHWPSAMSALLAGGGLAMGTVVGATNKRGETPVDRPLGPEDVLQTVYHVLGIDTSLKFPDDSGRPMPILNVGKVIRELV